MNLKVLINTHNLNIKFEKINPISVRIVKKSGFTIVELLVVIVIIGILAAITTVSYSGIANRAAISVVTSDLYNASQQLKLYQAIYGSYPTVMTNNCPTAPVDDPMYCIKPSNGSTLAYSSLNAETFHLTETKGDISYSTTNSTTPVAATTTNGSSVGSACPVGFIPVPGSGTYGTNDFCIMKYEAKVDDNGDVVGDTNQTTGVNTWPADVYPISSSRKLVSTAAGYPVASISQTTAINVASNTDYVKGCNSSCHLITEAERMTIAQNVLSVASNWSSGIVGSGYIYSGHSDAAPATALVADSSDANGYSNETNSGGNQRRTLTLSNGQVIWDFAGNAWEWTTATIAGNKQAGILGEITYNSKQWNNSSLLQNGLLSSSMPASTNIPGITVLGTAQGIGQIYSNYGESALHGFLRGGDWDDYEATGLLSLNLDANPIDEAVNIGMRVAAVPGS